MYRVVSLFICKFPGSELILWDGMRNGILRHQRNKRHLISVELKSCNGRNISNRICEGERTLTVFETINAILLNPIILFLFREERDGRNLNIQVSADIWS